MEDEAVVDTEWDHVVLMLPDDLKMQLCGKVSVGASAPVGSAPDLLRVCLRLGLCDMSLRQLAAWCSCRGCG